jgi:hypothetical protein
VEIDVASPASELALPADITSGTDYATSATVPSYAGECPFVRENDPFGVDNRSIAINPNAAPNGGYLKAVWKNPWS